MRFAIVGMGFMGRTHMQALRRIPEASVEMIVTRDPAKLLAGVGNPGNLNVTLEPLDLTGVRLQSELRAVLADSTIDAVDLCLPTDMHAEAAIASLEAGKHVLVEKPMALTISECNRMVEAAEKSGRCLMVAQVIRFWDAYQPLIEAKTFGPLGSMRSAYFRRRCAAPAWNPWLADHSRSGGGVFDLLIHDVDLCLSLFGAPRAVSAIGYEDITSGVDVLNAHLHYDEIDSVVVTGGWVHPGTYPFSMEYTVGFDGGTIEFSTEDRPATLYGGDGTQRALALPDRDGFEAEIRYFIDCASSGAAPERCLPRESAASVRLTLLLLESRRQSGRMIEWTA